MAALPALYAQIAAPKGSSYLGFTYNTDDHMVYSAWMRQAMDGRFFFDNRFTTDPQPGLTVHLYFWILGLVAKLTGIPLAANLARLFFTGLFVPLIYKLIQRVSPNVFTTRVALALAVLGGGIGFLVWHNFGLALVRPETQTVGALTLGTLPTDVWQPEGFVFPSMLTNGLFMVSLCLMVFVFLCFLDARDNWKSAAMGAVALGVLMNVHSYDVLTVAAVMVGFLAMQVSRREVTGGWLLRSIVIALGVVPAALWFMHVLQSDPVFQARAATETFSPNFRQVFFGYVGLIVLALAGILGRRRDSRSIAGVSLVALLLVAMLVAAGSAPDKAYFMSPAVWIVVVAVGVAALVCLATENITLNLLIAWGVMGILVLYFPALFQRKLAEGLSVPWALLAALGLGQILQERDRSARNLAAVFVVLMLSASSVRWLLRDMKVYIDSRVPNTTLHPIFLTRDMREIVALLNQDSGRKVVLSMPGIWSPEVDEQGKPIPDRFAEPVIPDLNPVVSGLTGAYTYAGHWSETPHYDSRRGEATQVFLRTTPAERRVALLQQIKPTYIIAPAPETYGQLVADLTDLGQVVYSGTQFKLIRVR